MNIKTFFKKQTYQTKLFMFLTFAVLIDILLFLVLGATALFFEEKKYHIVAEVIGHIIFFTMGLPFLFLKHKKEVIDEEIKAKKIQYEFLHLADGEIHIEGVDKVEFEKIEKINIKKT